jgi:hypothetical protein
MARALELLLVLVGLALVAVGANNAFSDSNELLDRASDLACSEEGLGCRIEGMYVERGPIAQDFTFTTMKHRFVRVRCSRANIAFGAYECTRRDTLQTPAGGSTSPTALQPARTSAPR